MQFLNFAAVLALSSTVLAAPTALVGRAARNSQNMVVPVVNGLNGTDAGQVLQYILLGVGTQNYTCVAGDATAKPAGNGAVATVYDMTSISDDRNGAKKLPYVPAGALVPYYSNNPKMLAAVLAMTGYNKVLGKHYFVAGTPVFDLSGAGKGEVFRGKRLEGVPAPANAFAGKDNEGAVDWLKLIDNGTSTGIKSVFRVYTAGGKAPATCQNSPAAFEVKYATEYWVYA